MGPIGFLDSGVGGLTILDAVHKVLPQHDTLYFSDSLHAPYGSKSPDELYLLAEKNTRQLFEAGCPLIIYACNTISALALRRIQKELLPEFPGRKILGVIRPTVEAIASSYHKNVLILSTPATAGSKAYEKEFQKINPRIKVHSHGCPNWSSLVESGKAETKEAEIDIAHEFSLIHKSTTHYDAALLACTHYPYLASFIQKQIAPSVKLYHQGDLVAASLAEYLTRHPEIDTQLSKQGVRRYISTGDATLSTLVASERFHHPASFTDSTSIFGS